jgi:hypothetical protein
MSSIYKKGRDGYFYYQAYRYNPNSKKKDRRIFHSLGTKDVLVAKNKQKKLDLKYEKIDSNLNNYFPILLNSSIPLKIFFTVVLFLFFILYFILSNFWEDKSAINRLINKNQKKKTNTSSDQLQFSNNFQNKASDLDQVKSQDLQLNQELENIELPKYTIENVEDLSGPFKLCKISITMDKDSNNDTQKKVCQSLTKEYSKFSNIIICIYSDDDIGKNISMGGNKEHNIKDQIESWLAMYTYNFVEGEYFDDKPTSYLEGN